MRRNLNAWMSLLFRSSPYVQEGKTLNMIFSKNGLIFQKIATMI